MKYKLLRFSLLSIFAMFWGMAFAQDETIDFSALGYENGQEVTEVNGTDVTLTLDKGTNNNAPKYYTTGTALRLYGGNIITVSSSTKTVEKVVFTFSSTSNNLNDPTVSEGSYDSETSTWTGSASNFTITRGGSTGHARIQKMEFYFASGSGDTRLSTILTLGEHATIGTVGEQMQWPEVTLSDAAGAPITGETIEWESSNTEVAQIGDATINFLAPGTANITAKFAGNNQYKPSSANFTLTVTPAPYTSIAAMLTDITSTKTSVTYQFENLLVTYVNGQNTFVSDGKDAFLFYGSNLGLNAGEKITGTVTGQLYTYNGLPEMSVTADGINAQVTSTGNEVTWATIAADALANYINVPVIIENATYVEAGSGKNFTFSVDGQTLAVYNNWSIDITALEANKTYTLAGIGSIYARGETTTYQLYLVSIEEYTEPVWAWADIYADFTDQSFFTEADASGATAGLKMNADGGFTRVAADDVTANAVISGKYHSPEHGISNFSATVKVEGPVMITFGTCAWGGNVTVKDETGAEVVPTFTTNTGACYHQNKQANVVSAYYKGGATVLAVAGGSYVPYFSVVAVDPADIPNDAKVTFDIANVECEGVAPAEITVEIGSKITIPANRTLYKDGFTLTAWTDAAGAKYKPGDEVTVSGDITLTPVFSENDVENPQLGETITVVWDFQQKNGAPVLNYQNQTGIYVTQMDFGGYDLDFKLDFDTNNGGKIANGNWNDWCQMNTGTKFTIPAAKGMVVSLESYNATTTTTIAGSTDYTTEGNVVTYTYEGSGETIDIVIGDGSYFRYIKVVYPADVEEPASQAITGTWTYSNEDVMTATMALSGSTEAGEVEAVEKNGLMMVVEANGASFRNNGDNIQVRSGAVFKIPVKNAGDLVTVKGYPNYSYYTIGNSTEELNNENTYTAKRSDAEAGYVAVTSTNDNNYYYAISVVQYAPKEKVTLDNEPATITFTFNEGTEGQTATFSNADYFLNSKVSHGTGVVLEGKDNKGMNQTWFNPVAKDSKANEGNAIRFLFTPKPGLTFTPTKVSFKSTRFGTNGGKLDIAWQNPDGTAVNLASGEQPVRDNADPNVSEFVYDVAGAAGGEGTCGLCINLYSLDNGKHVGFSDILIEGVLNGTEKDVPVLASFKINGNEYAVEDVFGEAYEATLELPKAEQMVGVNNPLTDVTAASGEVGEITYEEKDDACTVTIPMTAGETQMNYILNVVFKPDFTLTYLDVEGNVLTTQTVEKDAKIGQFAYDIENVSSTKNGFKARGWFKQDYLGAKFTIEDVITSDVNLYAIETEIEVPSASRKYVYDLTNQWFYDEDHEGFNSLGSGYWHDTQHGWAFNNGDQIELLVGPKATINFSLCQYSKAGATIVGSNGASTIGVVESDGGAGSMDYEGEPGTLTLTINSEGAVYIHSITVFNTSEANFAQQGEWIIVKQGDASSLLDAIEVAKGIENAKIFVPDGTYDLGETVKTVISGKNVSLIGQSAEKTVIVNRPPVAMEGLDKADLLKNTGEGLYMQDITLKNDLSYAGNDGRAAALHDQGTKTIGKNVFLLSHQDTYYSHRVGGLFYWEGGELHGTVDYLCGNGKVYYQDVKLVNEVRGSATVTANSEIYVFNNCTIENHASTWNLGRAWSDNPVCVYLNTTMLDPDHLASTRWNLSGLNCDYSVAGEYGTKNASGSDITPESNWVTFTKQNTRMNTILDASALDTYSMENVLGDWAATAKAETMQVGAPLGTYENGTVSFTPANNDAIAYALFKNGEFVGITEGNSFDVEATKADKLTIRAANSRGGFGEPVEVTISTGVEEIANGEQSVPETIYNLNGVRVQKAQKGLYIINGRKVVMK